MDMFLKLLAMVAVYSWQTYLDMLVELLAMVEEYFKQAYWVFGRNKSWTNYTIIITMLNYL